MATALVPSVAMVSVDRITIVNPRVRSKRVFKENVANIAELGLKRPITVARREGSGKERYDLVCGQAGSKPIRRSVSARSPRS
jgi:ParB family transcriptional regulator, chromosome partitioning protein